MDKPFLIFCIILLLIRQSFGICTDTVCCSDTCTICGSCTGNISEDILCCESVIITNSVICNTNHTNSPCVLPPTTTQNRTNNENINLNITTIDYIESANYSEIRTVCCNGTTLINNDYCIGFSSDVCKNLTDVCCENTTYINNTFCNSFNNLTCPTVEDVCCNGRIPYNNTYCNQFYYLACTELSNICCNYTEIIDNEYCNRFGDFKCKNITELCCKNGKKKKNKYCNSFNNITCSKKDKEKVIEFLAYHISTNYVIMSILIAVVLCLIVLFAYACCCFGHKSPPIDYGSIIGKVGDNK